MSMVVMGKKLGNLEDDKLIVQAGTPILVSEV